MKPGDIKSENKKFPGGLLVGETDKNGGGGISVIAPEGNITMGGGEIIINEASSKKYCEELSKINSEDGNGVVIPCGIKNIANTTDSKMEAGDIIKAEQGTKISSESIEDKISRLKSDLLSLEMSGQGNTHQAKIIKTKIMALKQQIGGAMASGGSAETGGGLKKWEIQNSYVKTSSQKQQDEIAKKLTELGFSGDHYQRDSFNTHPFIKIGELIFGNYEHKPEWDGSGAGFIKKYEELQPIDILSFKSMETGGGDYSFDYQMLSRLQLDNDAYLDGIRQENRLWAGNVDDQIKEMKRLWNKLPIKPEWLSMEDILEYEKKMKEQHSSGGGSMASGGEVKNMPEKVRNRIVEYVLTSYNDDPIEKEKRLKLIYEENNIPYSRESVKKVYYDEYKSRGGHKSFEEYTSWIFEKGMASGGEIAFKKPNIKMPDSTFRDLAYSSVRVIDNTGKDKVLRAYKENPIRTMWDIYHEVNFQKHNDDNHPSFKRDPNRRVIAFDKSFDAYAGGLNDSHIQSALKSIFGQIFKEDAMAVGGKINESEVTEMMAYLQKEGPLSFINQDNIEMANELVRRGAAEKTSSGYALTKSGEKELMETGGKIDGVFDEYYYNQELKKINDEYNPKMAELYTMTPEWNALNKQRDEKVKELKNKVRKYYRSIDTDVAFTGDGLTIKNWQYSLSKRMHKEQGGSLPLHRIEDTENKDTKTCKCPTMEYHNQLSETQKEELGSKYIAEGTTIKDTKTGTVSDIVSVVHNGFNLLPQSGLDNAPRTEFFVPFKEIVDKHGKSLIEVGGYENTEPDHKLLILVIKDIMASNIIQEREDIIHDRENTIQNLNDKVDNEVLEEVPVTEEMAHGGIIGEMKANRAGAIKEIRDINGKLLKQVYVGDKLYKRNFEDRNYRNSVNDLLLKFDAAGIHMAYGGIVGVETLPNFYRVDIASPKNVKTCRTPKWAQHVAESVKKGAKVTTCKKYKKWFPSAILVPKDGITASEAEHLGREIKDKIEHKKMEHGGVIFETGATSHKVNNLILFADTTSNLAEMRDSVYDTIKNRSTLSPEQRADRFKAYLLKVKSQYVREMGNTKEAKKQATLTPAEDKEFLKITLENMGTIYEAGGQMPEIDYDQVRAIKYWGELKTKQRLHFLLDHVDYVFDKPLKDIPAKVLTEYKKMASAHWTKLPKEVQMAVEEHVIMGTYEHGGELTDYTSSNQDINEFIGDDIDSTVNGILVLIECTEDPDEKEKLRNKLKEYDYKAN